MNNAELLQRLANLPAETEWLEFKHNGIHHEEIGEYISALSNAASLCHKEAAYLIFGVDDKSHALIGTSFRFRESKVGNEDLEAWLNRLLNPHVDFMIEEFDIDSKYFVLIKILATSNRPVAFKNTAFIRIGSYKKKLSDYPEKERKLWQKIDSFLFETDIAMENCTESDITRLLDGAAYFELLKLNFPNTRASIIEKFLEEGFIKENLPGIYSILNLGAILFAKDLTEFSLLARKIPRIIVYQHDDRLETIKEWSSKKGYAISYTEITNYIIDQLPQNEIIEKAIRHQVKMYPDIVIRELVANALIHQDFFQRGTSVMVEIFKHRIEISNPGKPLINTLRFIDHIPCSRNEKLASFFRRVDFCEERGSGVDKIISAVEAYQLPAPEFIEYEHHLKVVVHSHKNLRGMGRSDRIRACYQHCCIKYVVGDIATNKSLRTRFEVEEKNYAIVSRIIAETMEEGLIKPADAQNKSKKHASYVPFWS